MVEVEAAPLRIVLVGSGMIPIPPPGYGAVEKHIWNLAGALQARGNEVRIVNTVVGERSLDEYRFALHARKEIAREPYEVLHLHTPGVATILQALGPRRFVYTTHSRHWSTVEGVGERIGFFLERRAVAAATEAIAVSRLVAEQVDRRMHVIPNGVDVLAYAPHEGVRGGASVVGVGEVAEHKRWHLAARALAGTRGKLTVIGPIRDTAYAKLLEREGTRLLGPVPEDELTRHLAGADVLVHPSVSESFGMAVVEGMASGLPIVCSDMLSFLVEHGKQGFLVPTRAADDARVEALRSALPQLLSDDALRRRMGHAARERAVERYAWERVAEQVEAVYRRAAR